MAERVSSSAHVSSCTENIETFSANTDLDQSVGKRCEWSQAVARKQVCCFLNLFIIVLRYGNDLLETEQEWR